jgi:hypothetical protein
VVAADVDISQVDFVDVEGQSRATLDTILVVAHRDSGEAERIDQLVEIQRKTAALPSGPVWYSFLREVLVPAGEFQAKLVVRDPNSKRVGTVAFEFGIPPRDQLRVSTPILTDKLNPSPSGPVPAIIVRRQFLPNSQLLCRFDVYGAGRAANGLPKVLSGHAIRRADGTPIAKVEPTTIESTSLGAVARMIQLPLTGLPGGDYELVLTVTDSVRGVSQEVVEPFSIVADASRAR